MNHLHNAVRKCSYQFDRQWGGYLLPKEVLSLRDFGINIHPIDEFWAVDCKRNGRTYGRWVYFDLVKGENEKKFKILKEGLSR